MARPINADPEQTRTRLLDAAGELFSSRGIEGVSLREVAVASGSSLGTLQYYFKTKDELYQACQQAAIATVSDELAPMSEMLAGLMQSAREATTHQVDVGRLVDGMIRQAFRFSRSHQAVLQLIMRPLIETGEMSAPWREQVLVPFLDQTTALLSLLLDRDPAGIRFAVQSLTALGMRYALSSPRELAQLAALPTETPAARAVEHTENGLVALARQLLSLAPDD